MAEAENIDLFLLPHADLHVVRDGPPAPTLKLDVKLRTFPDPNIPDAYGLTSVLDTTKFKVDFTFFAPHNSTPRRFDGVPKVAPDGTVDVSQADLGVYLFQVGVVRKDSGKTNVGAVVGRLQVHKTFDTWWFGNDSITTALDSRFAHAQPSIYARFSDDPSGSDLIGDITGHGYVKLVSNSASVVIDAAGRLKGLAETGTTTPATVTGTFLEAPPLSRPPLTLSARVVDYGKSRPVLEPVRNPDLTHLDAKSNIVFLAEGFRETDRALFNKVVEDTARDMFTQPRHEPYGLLKDSFNVFRVFAASQDEQATCGFPVTDNNAVFGVRGVPIPSITRFQGAVLGKYTLKELVEIVGLPRRGEARNFEQLTKFWVAQGIPGFDLGRTDAPLVEAWKEHRADGFLRASDTMFGLYLGSRWADGSTVSTTQRVAVPIPAGDAPGDPVEGPKLAALIARLYAFYKSRSPQELTLDPRRHPPELYADSNRVNPGSTLMSYLGGLQYVFPPNTPIGKTWVPDGVTLKPSVGLVAIVTYDEVNGGSAINANTLTASTVAEEAVVRFTPDGLHPELFRRNAPRPPTPANPTGIVKLDLFINKAAHEFGHVFDLDDEYELFGSKEDPFDALGARDIPADNISSIGFLRIAPAPDRHLTISRVKWLTLPRITVSSRLLEATLPDVLHPTQITVTVGPDELAKWVAVQKAGLAVTLLNRTGKLTRQQLPLPRPGNVDHLTGLRIIGTPDAVRGSLVLNDPSGLPIKQTFREGSVLYVQRKNPSGTPSFVVEDEVAAFLRSTALPLNRNRDLTVPSKEDQIPLPIFNFKPPHNAFRLVGIYEGGKHESRGFYRPAGTCKMRNQNDLVHDGRQFCHVCKWLLVNLVDGGRHALLDDFYPKRPR